MWMPKVVGQWLWDASVKKKDDETPHSRPKDPVDETCDGCRMSVLRGL